MGSQSKDLKDKAVKIKYVEWLRVPKTKRSQMKKVDKTFPATKAEFAKHYGVDRVTLWRWEQNSDLKKLVMDEKFKLLGTEEFEAMMEHWKVEAKKDFKVFQKLVEWSGILERDAAPTDDEEDAEMFSKMSDAELQAFLQAEDDGDGEDDEAE